MEIKIEKGLPLPEKKWAQYGLIAAALKQMEIGDSFECNESQRCAASQAAHRHGIKVLTRKTGQGLVRVWRVS